MSDAVLAAIQTLANNMNAFYISIFLFLVAALFIVFQLLRDALWWKGLWQAMFGIFFTIAIDYAVGEQIIPSNAISLSWLGYIFVAVGGVLFVVGVIERWLEYAT